MGFATTANTTYQQEEDFYYLQKGATKPEPLPGNKKDFNMIFLKNRPQMIAFAKENNISIHDAEDLKAIFAYYNKLARS